MEEKERPLAQVEDVEELKERYRLYSDEILLHWSQAVVGPHRAAMLELLRERGVGMPAKETEDQ